MSEATFWRKEPPELDDARQVIRGGMWPSQAKWWELTNFIRMMVGGFGSGKSMTGGKRIISLAMLNAPVPVMVVSPTYTLARETTIATIRELLQGKQTIDPSIKFRYNKNSHEWTIQHGTRVGRILQYSGDNPDSLRGPNIAAGWIDEPFIQAEEVFHQVIARIRHPRAKKLELNLTGCVVRGTIVLTPDGFVEIDDLDPGSEPKQYRQLDVPVYGQGGFHTATRFFNNGRDRTVRLRLTKGFEIHCTPDHPVLTIDEDLRLVWKRAGARKGKYADLDQLRLTDRVAVARGMEVWGNRSPAGLTNDDAYAAGVWLAEGSTWQGKRGKYDVGETTITCGDEGVLRHFTEKGFRGFLFTRKKNPDRDDQVRCTHRGLHADMAENLGLQLVKAPRKRLPRWVMAGGKREHVLQFLGGMYDGDGHVCQDGKGGIGYSTASVRMARQLQTLLLNFGVCADVFKTVSKPQPGGLVQAVSHRWVVLATGSNARKLAAILPVRIERKRQALEHYKREYRDSETLPNAGSVIERLWRGRQKLRWRNRDGEKLTGSRIIESIRINGIKNVSLHYARTFCKLWRLNEPDVPEEIERIEALLAADYYWAGIQSIRPGIERDTVDFVIPETHSFLANGIISRNTPEELGWGYELAEGELGKRHDVGVVHLSTRENLALDPAYVQRLLASYPGLLGDAYVDGQFVNLASGKVYWGFDRRIHVKAELPHEDDYDGEDLTKLIPPGAELGVGMDFNVNPFAMIAFWRAGPRMHFFHEFELPNADTEYACQELRTRFGERLHTIYPDSTGGQRATQAPEGRTDFWYIRKAGFEIVAPHAPPKRRDRFNSTNAKFKDMTITVSPRCRKLTKYLMLYTHKDMNKDDHKAMSHLLDAFSYPIVYLFPLVGNTTQMRVVAH